MPHSSDQKGYDPYRINSIQEIDHILLSLLKKGTLLRMHSGNPHNAVITTLLDIDFDHDMLVIDSAAQQTMNQQLAERQQAYIEALLDQVAIEFHVQPLSPTMIDGRPALTGPIPLFIRRIQRRANFRIQPSIYSPVQCTIELTPQQQITVPVFDISSSGVSILMEAELTKINKGRIFTESLLHLPDADPISVNLEVVQQYSQIQASGKKIQRYGCAFSKLQAQDQVRIQNYITQEERLQIARERGLA